MPVETTAWALPDFLHHLILQRRKGKQILVSNRTTLVAGAGGFIGGHLVADLLARGVTDIRAVDIKPFEEWYQVFDDVENVVARLQESMNAARPARAPAGLQPGRRHGRHGLHRKQQGRCACSRC